MENQVESSSAPSQQHAVQRLGFAAMLASNLCLAFGPWFVRLADTGPVAAGFWRLALAAPMLLVLAPLARQPLTRLSPALVVTIAIGGVLFAADLASWHVGILHTKMANATLFGNATSLMFPIYGFIAARAWPTRMQGVAFGLATVGTLLLMGRSYELSANNLLGDLLCLLAGVLYTCYFIAIERARVTLQPLPLLALCTIAAALPMLMFAIALGEQVMPQHWSALFGLALLSQVIGQGLIVYAIGVLPPVVIGLGLLTQPMIAAVIGWLAYDERLGTLDMVGAVAIAIALVLVRAPSPKSTAG
ncbi:drug/metabolite transporter (DMT)-like permease [Sphingomonas zeicaulis]|uniref:DMT family transporter n=1 Tax=Sphingomonas zeicaulis TaxID=1632740 RepID=UPI003D1EB6DA